MKKIRYAVLGLGHIAQTAVLPAFRHAKKNSELVALVSGDPVKLKKLGAKYKVPYTLSYEEFEPFLKEGRIDAVYIATPNVLHQDFSEMAARNGVHVLTEKPMATEEKACRSMIESAKRNKVKLMVAYRLHFNAANLEAIRIAQSGKIGEPKIFNSVFTMQVRDKNNIRLHKKLGGGTLYDIGIYCINAARYLFRDEPVEVFAMSSKKVGKNNAENQQARFREVDEMTTAILRFPRDRVASFTTSFGASDSATYDLIGTTARLRLENAYEYADAMELLTVKEEKTHKKSFSMHDQFGPELLYFSDCILNNKEPEPSGREGLADVKVINALLKSVKLGRMVKLNQSVKAVRPSPKQTVVIPPVKLPHPIHVRGPS